MKAELAQRMFELGDRAAVSEAAEVSILARQALEDMRALSIGYRNTCLTTEIASARSLLKAAGVPLRLIGAHDSLPDKIRGVFGWVLREAVTNAIRHADETYLEVEVVADASQANLVVRNNGAPPEPVTPKRGRDGKQVGGSGLLGLQERLRNVGGNLAATQSRDVFELVASAPLA
jgi:two-component system sensor histidine kinase DesK